MTSVPLVESIQDELCQLSPGPGDVAHGLILPDLYPPHPSRAIHSFIRTHGGSDPPAGTIAEGMLRKLEGGLLVTGIFVTAELGAAQLRSAILWDHLRLQFPFRQGQRDQPIRGCP